MYEWKRIGSKLIYDKFIKLHEDDIIDPNGNPGIRNRIEITSGSVVIIPRDKDNNYYLIGQQRYAVNEYSWEFPNGGIENGEKPEEAAVRELGEETEKETGDLHYLGYFHPVNSLMNRNVHVFFANNVEPTGNKTWQSDDYERLELKMFKMSEIEVMILNNKISDGFTIAALSKYNLWIKNK
jgi:8-oxo-dGTP pyrophosphatase MutT (NUDIX family)